VARAYRARLRTTNQGACDETDALMVEVGQLWVVDPERLWADTDLITTGEAAALVGVNPATIHQWASTTVHPDDPGRLLLARAGRRGRERTYVAADVLAAARLAETRPLTRRRAA
jgi:hypothetical protein